MLQQRPGCKMGQSFSPSCVGTMRTCLTQAVFLATMLISQAHAQNLTTSFVPEKVFAGRSEGNGELHLFFGRRQAFSVASLGTLQGDGSFRLVQDVHFEGKPATSRAWLMRQTSPGHYAATLTEASAPAVGRTDGSRLTLRYPLTHWGLVMHQTLDLAADGQTVHNLGTIRFFGIPVGHLRETIQLKH